MTQRQYAVFLHNEKLPTFTVEADNWADAWKRVWGELCTRDTDTADFHQMIQDPNPRSTTGGTRTAGLEHIRIYAMPHRK